MAHDTLYTSVALLANLIRLTKLTPSPYHCTTFQQPNPIPLLDTLPTHLHQRNLAFRQSLESLNPAQRQAVERIEGPVLVIAGPGTGKTHLLSARVGKILLDTDTRPQNILCLTFTDAGVSAMRARLLERIGPEAHRVPIQTFHAFCNRVIQENLEVFGRTNLEPLTELERIEIVRHLLSQLPSNHPLREGQKDVYQYESHLRDLFANLKKEGWTPEQVVEKTNAYLAALPEHPDFIYQRNTKHAKKGEPKSQKIEETTERMQRLKAAAELYPKYQAALEKAGRYEYEDMLLWVLRAFGSNEALLRNYQERYLYVMVDEYQDTNGAQNHLLHLLLDYWDNPNIFIVGDDDQSIYEFQGARLQNLLDFHRQYRADLLTVVLEENYRSTQGILDAAHRVIEHNTIRAIHSLDEPLTKDLRAHTPAQAEPRLYVYENRLQEVADVVAQIETLIQQGTPPQEIAVLYARHKQAARLLTLLEKKGVAYQTKRPINLLDLPWMQQFRSLLRYLQDESLRPFSGEARLFRLLHAAFFGLVPLDLARVAILLQPSPQARVPGGEPGHWRILLANTSALHNLQLHDPQRLITVAQYFEQWIADLPNLPLPAFIERLYTQSGLLTYALNQPDKVWWLQTLHTFLHFVQTEALRHPRFTLGRLLSVLDSMDDNRLSLPVQQPLRSVAEGVQLFTAHGAKGLEFEHVFMLDCTDDYWGKNAAGYRGRFALPDTLTLSGEEDALEARRRLFYVAMTRAKRHLQMSYARLGEDQKPLNQVGFVEETLLPKTAIVVPADTLLETQTLLLLESAQPVITLPEPALLDDLLRNFSLSISALSRYLRCPLAFYYTDLLGIPETMSEAAAYGAAMHHAMQQFFLKMKNEAGQFGTLESLARTFAAEMERQRGFFSEHAFTQRLALGKDHLRRYHAAQLPHWRTRSMVERRVDRVELDGVPLTGVLDKVEWLDNATLRIVDYKTSTPDLKKTAPPDEKQPHGGDYWRQMAFYKILLDRSRMYPESVGRVAVSWLTPDRKGVFPVLDWSFSVAEIQGVEQLIRTTYAKIQAREFTQGCGQEDCGWCRMHRDRQKLYSQK